MRNVECRVCQKMRYAYGDNNVCHECSSVSPPPNHDIAEIRRLLQGVESALQALKDYVTSP